jgi:uncharacterized delta-60 repeat protein
LQANGKIVVAGYADTSVHTFDVDGNDLGVAHYQFALARYSSGGVLDPSFGSAGKAFTDFADVSRSYGNATAIQPDGKIVVAGNYNFGDLALARYLGDPSNTIYLPFIKK